jgi:hypothetical protein
MEQVAMIRSLLIPFSVTISLLLLPSIAPGQDARSILQTMQKKEISRWDGVDNYVVEQSMLGHRTLLFYEKISVTAADGKVYPSFRMVMPDEIARRQNEERGFPQFTPEDLRAAARGADMTGEALGTETEREMKQAGLPPGLLGAASPSRFATLDPRVMMGNVSDFYDASADAVEASDNRDKAAEARDSINDMAEFAAAARLMGTESVDGRNAYILRADDINRTQRSEDGQEFTIRTATLWIDAAEHVPLRMSMDGTATSGGETRAITIEKHDQDYRRVGSLYMPYRQVVRIAGIMDAEQEAQMHEAQQQMAEFEVQMQQMPESQRQMMMKMMGPQMEMMKKMAAGGGIEMVTDVHQVRVNAGLPNEIAMGSVLFQPQALPTDSTKGSQAFNTSSTPSASAGSPVLATVQDATAQDPAALKTAQQACLQQKIDEAQKAQKKKRGLGRLVSAISRTAARAGNSEIARAASNVFAATATAEDLAGAARDLGITEDEVAACQNPM